MSLPDRPQKLPDLTSFGIPIEHLQVTRGENRVAGSLMMFTIFCEVMNVEPSELYPIMDALFENAQASLQANLDAIQQVYNEYPRQLGVEQNIDIDQLALLAGQVRNAMFYLHHVTQLWNAGEYPTFDYSALREQITQMSKESSAIPIEVQDVAAQQVEEEVEAILGIEPISDPEVQESQDVTAKIFASAVGAIMTTDTQEVEMVQNPQPDYSTPQDNRNIEVSITWRDIFPDYIRSGKVGNDFAAAIWKFRPSMQILAAIRDKETAPYRKDSKSKSTVLMYQELFSILPNIVEARDLRNSKFTDLQARNLMELLYRLEFRSQLQDGAEVPMADLELLTDEIRKPGSQIHGSENLTCIIY